MRRYLTYTEQRRHHSLRRRTTVAFEEPYRGCRGSAGFSRQRSNESSALLRKLPMNERPALTHSLAQLNDELQRCLGALLSGKCDEAEFVEAVRGNCTESEFIDAIIVRLRAAPDSKAKIMAVLNRMQSRGEVSLDLVHFLESKIAEARLPNSSNDQTVDLAINGTSCVVFGGPPPSRVEIGRILRDRYVIEKRLGSGGRGTVFKALDRFRSSLPPSQQYVAIKILHGVPHGRDAMIESLQRELYCAQRLSHANIVNVFELDRDGDIDFFTMELLEGELLSSVMARFAARPMHRPHAWAIIRQIASGLEHAHSRDVVHADLKPQNIMITDSGEVRLLDFGSSSIFSKQPSSGREHGSRSASAAYSSCEILEGRAGDRRDDLYSLACISYELLTGTHPFLRRRANEARDLGIIATRPSGLSRRQWQTLAKGLSSHRAGRSISVSDWFKKLNPDSKEEQRLPSSKDLLPALPSAPTSTSSLRTSAVLTLLAVTVATWMLFVRMAPGGRVIGETVSSTASAGQVESSVAGIEPGIRDPSASSPFSLAPLAQSQGKANSDSSRARLLSQTNHPTAVSASGYEVRPGERFAEIRVHRSPELRGDVPFVWWTEAASAKPGVDYVQQAKVTQSLPSGKSSISFFVKLLPRASRNRREVFYVAIGDAAGGPSLGQIVHAAVWLPSNDAAEPMSTPRTANVVNSASGTN
jgi:serine/threonine protein kinase